MLVIAELRLQAMVDRTQLASFRYLTRERPAQERHAGELLTVGDADLTKGALEMLLHCAFCHAERRCHTSMFYAALLGCFFLALAAGCAPLASALLFLFFLTRKSTLLLALAWRAIA